MYHSVENWKEEIKLGNLLQLNPPMNLLQAFSYEQFKELEGIKRKAFRVKKKISPGFDHKLFGIFKGLI